MTRIMTGTSVNHSLDRYCSINRTWLLRRCGARWRVIVPDVADNEPLAVDPAPDLDVLAGLNGLAGGVDHRGGARVPGEIARDADVAEAVLGREARGLDGGDVLRQEVFDRRAPSQGRRVRRHHHRILRVERDYLVDLAGVVGVGPENGAGADRRLVGGSRRGRLDR